MSRKKIVAGNWKMNMSFEDGVALAEALVATEIANVAQVVLGTPYIHLKR